MARIHILRDISDLGLDPKVAHSGVKGGGRLKAPVVQKVDDKEVVIQHQETTHETKQKKPKTVIHAAPKAAKTEATPEAVAPEAEKKDEKSEDEKK